MPPKKPEEEISHHWHQGKVQVTERELYEKSGFQRELDMYEEDIEYQEEQKDDDE